MAIRTLDGHLWPMPQTRALRLLLVAALLLGAPPIAAPARASATSVAPRQADIPRIAVMAAFDRELEVILSKATITETRIVNGRTHHLGTLGGQPVVILLSGFSIINAAMTTQALLDRYDIQMIVFSGIAGGVNPSLQVGDVTVPAQWGNYQESVFGRATATGFHSDRITTAFANYGMMFPQGTSVTVRGAPADSLVRRFWFPVDSTALAQVGRIAPTVRLNQCVRATICVSHQPRLVIGGNGVAGPTFVDNAEYREWVWATFRADALDMESSAVAVVAYENKVPYIVFRGLSDLAGGGEGPNVARSYGQLAAANAAAVVIAYLESLPRPVAP
jgi:adenosylhomocysteine nucleosidase